MIQKHSIHTSWEEEHSISLTMLVGDVWHKLTGFMALAIDGLGPPASMGKGGDPPG